MATIKSILSLEDKMTPQLSKAEKQAMANVKAYKDLQKQLDDLRKTSDEYEATGKNNTKMFDNLMDSIEATEREMKAYEDGMRNADMAQGKTTTSATELNQALELVSKGWDMLSKAVQKATELMELNNKQFNAEYTSAVKMQNMMGMSKEDIQSMYDYAEALQKVTTMGDEAIISASGILATSASNKESLQALTKAAVYATEGLEGLDASQSSLESTAGYLQKALEGSASQLYRNRVLTKKQADYIDSLNDTQEKEAELARIVTENFASANDMLVNSAQGGIKQADNALSDLGETLGSKVTPYFTAFKNLLVQLVTPAVQVLADNMNIVIPVLITFGVILGVLVSALTVYQAACWLAALAEAGVLWPLLLVIAIIGVLIGLVWGLAQAVSDASEQTLSTLGIVLGWVIMGAVNIYNNVIVYLQNKVATFVNFFANVFIDPITSVELLFIDLGRTVAGIFQTISQTMDVLFGTNTYSVIGAWVDDLKNTRDELLESSEYKEVIQPWERVDSREAYEWGYNLGEGFDKTISDISGNFDLSNISDILDNLDTTIGIDTTGGSALKTTTDDKLLSDEDIQLLLDVATRDYKLNYQQVTPNITLTFGDIRETADIDDVLDKLADRLEEIVDGDLEVATNG